MISDDAAAPGESEIHWSAGTLNRDPYLVFTAPADGVYYIGVSGFGNDRYDPRSSGVGTSDPADITVFNGEVYFTAYTPATGRELWKLNAAGVPVLVADIHATGSSDPAELTVFNNELFFTADTPQAGRELWKLTADGVVSQVVDVFANGSSNPTDLTVYNNALYFAAFTTASGRELWKTTAGGVATEVADIDPFSSSNPADLLVFNNELYFSASSPTFGRELWKVNAAGVATNVVDLEPNGSSEPAGMTVFNGELYFSATTLLTGRELWRVNATGLPSQAAEINPLASSDPADLQVFNNALYFAATSPVSGRELWQLDVFGNTALAADIHPSGSSDPASLEVFENELYFSAQGSQGGRELWKLTAAGAASQVTELEPNGSADPTELKAAGGALYFSAFTTASGRELWRLTSAGAVSQVADLDQSQRVEGSTGRYEIEILRPWNSNGLVTESYARTGDSNLFRDQGQLIIRDSFISDSAEYGIVVQAAPRDNRGAAIPGPVRNLATVNTERLVPGTTITNNVLAYNRSGGIRFSGDVPEPIDPTIPIDPDDPTTIPVPAPRQPAAVPFGRVLNNTIYGADRNAFRLVPVDIVFAIDTTGSMTDDVQAIREHFADFDAALRFAGIDPHYGLVTFPGGTATPAQIQDITDFTTFTDPEGPFQTFTVPAGGAKEYGSLALREALNDVDPETTFSFRPETQIMTVLVTDEEDDSTLADFNAALNAFWVNSAIFFGITLNPDLPNDVDSPTNNTDARYGELARRTGGEVFDIAAFALDPQPFFEGFVDALSGVLVGPGTTGILVENSASPTLLNNIVVALETGIHIDDTSLTTVVGGTVYQDNETDAIGIVTESFPLRVASGVTLFRDPYFGNFYPSANSPIIDSSVDALEDRQSMTQVSQPLGIAPSPIATPNHDALGQLRTDDPAVAPPPGLGENVFKDRGALDRADFTRPQASLVLPLDNGADDLDPSLTLVNLASGSLDRFSIQLGDAQPPLFGSGLDNMTVSTDIVRVLQDDQELVRGQDYTVWYDSTNNLLHIVPLAGVWDLDSNYVIRLQNQDRFVIKARSGEQIHDGEQFRLADEYGNVFTFEYDTGYILTVPESYAIQVPAQGGAPGGVADGDTVTVDVSLTSPTGTVTTISETIEFDSNGAVADENNLIITFTAASAQGELADALVRALRDAGLGLTPANAGNGLVQLGADGSQTLTIASDTLAELGGPVAVVDGDIFVIDNGSRLFLFEFSTDGFAGLGRIPVPFTMSQTNLQIAQALAQAVNGQAVGLTARNLGDGRVQLGGDLNHQVDVSESSLILSGEPGVRLPFGIRIPTVAGGFQDLLEDGETLVVTDSTGRSITFELDNNNFWTPGNTPVPYTSTTTAHQLADTLAIRIRDAGLGLWPYNAGNGVVILGGEGYSLDLTETGLAQVGISGLPGAMAIPVSPSAAFSEADVAAATAAAIDDLRLPGIDAAVDPATLEVNVTGAAALSGSGVQFQGAVRDLAGNALSPNQDNGETRFTVYMGVGMDFGNAPSPYPTLREDDGARHAILTGFSLGATVSIDANGQPTTSDGRDISDNDGVVFDPTTPLVPNRNFNVTVTTRGIVNDVVPFGVLSAWIDFNRDGDWLDTGEQILTNVVLNKSLLDQNGAITFKNLTVPAWAVPGETYVRFRLSTEGGSSSTGEAPAGEVEDYRVSIFVNPWQNPINQYDVNNDGGVSPIDALLLINYINANPASINVPLPLPKPAGFPFYDVTGDGYADARDVLGVINEINRLNTQLDSEGESLPAAMAVADGNHLDDVLRSDEPWLDILDDVHRSLGGGLAVDAVFADLGV